jgi:AI-2 transport protein TqsA
MKLDSRRMANWLVSGAVVLALLVLGRPLLVPLIFAVLLWSIFNALTDRLQRVGFPRWLAWLSSLVAVASALYLVARILGNEATALASRGPVYIAKLQTIFSGSLAILHLGQALNLANLVSRSDIAGMLGATAVSFGNLVFGLALVAVYIGFLLSEQSYLPAKLAKLTTDGARRDEGKTVIRTIARQVQAYLGVCTFLSAVMAAISYAVLAALGVEFAGFWALVMFLVTYIPTVGGVAVVLPALAALVQFGSLESFLIVLISLSAAHFVLANIVQTIMLGQSMNLSPFAIILSLSFWGMIWGIAGLFLAVPITAAIAIVCEHIDGAHWVTVLLAGPPPKRERKRE